MNLVTIFMDQIVYLEYKLIVKRLNKMTFRMG